MFEEHTHEHQAQSRPVNLLCAFGIATFLFISFEGANQKGCSELNITLCRNSLETCLARHPDNACDCREGYMRCLFSIDCNEVFPLQWNAIVNRCLRSGCSATECWSTIPQDLTPDAYPVTFAPEDISLPDDRDAKNCNKCFKTLMSCEGGLQVSWATNSTNCFCAEEFMACIADYHCLSHEEHSEMTGQCTDEWQCSSVQCSPDHEHGRYCEYKKKGLEMIVAAGVFTVMILGFLHVCVFPDLWAIPYDDTLEVGHLREVRQSCLIASAMPLLYILGRRNVTLHQQLGHWLGVAFYSAIGSAICISLYLTPYAHYQQEALNSPRSLVDLTSMCAFLSLCAVLGGGFLVIFLLSCVTYNFKASRLRATLGTGASLNLQMVMMGSSRTPVRSNSVGDTGQMATGDLAEDQP